MTLEIIETPSPNHDERPAEIDMLVLHYTGMKSGEAALARLRDAEAKVSSHYLIEEDGRIFRLVKEERRAWHAGISSWGGRDTLNDVSIGIELVNPGHEWGYRAFPEAQIAALEALAAEICERWRIPVERVLGHADIAPTRKDDPGELFPWQRLAQAGLALWPQEAEKLDKGRLLDPAGVATLERAMERFGYDVRDFPRALRAFRRRFRPTEMTGPATMRDFLIARSLASRYPAANQEEIRPITSGEFSREGV